MFFIDFIIHPIISYRLEVLHHCVH